MIQIRRNGEDYMEILDRKQVLSTSLDPSFFFQGLAFGTVPVPAGVIGYLQMAAVIALILMTAKDSCSAYLYGAHDSPIIAGQLM